MQFLGYLLNLGYFEKCPVIERVIVEVVSKNAYFLREFFQIFSEHSIFFL